MGIREELVDRSGNEEMLFADGYDDAIKNADEWAIDIPMSQDIK